MGGCCCKKRASYAIAPPQPKARKLWTEEESMDAQTNADFAIKLLKRLHGTSEGKGTFVSPMSVSMALGMAYAGAEGQTAAEMGAVLFPGVKDSNAVHAFFASIADVLNPDTSAYILHTANRLYAQKDMAFKEEFLGICDSAYKAPLAPVDFKSQKGCSKAAGEMNKWVDKMTKGLIKDIVSKDVLEPTSTSYTLLVVINAIYFKGTWVNKFSPRATKKEVFYKTPDDEVKLDMMKFEGGFEHLDYLENEAVQVLRLPYRSGLGNDMDMVIILPKQRYGIAEWLNKSSGEDVMTLIKATEQERVTVTLPKWRVEVTTELSSELAGMGMASAFDRFKAEFGGMADLASLTDLPPELRNIYISSVIQKAFVEVNEQGTEAAAMSRMHGKRAYGRGPPPSKIFKADQPFLYLLNCGPHILFAGVFQG